ncbi:TIR domain-containing protein [Herbaspirillum autotrophicum]|uniref:TIR domain-containing protein n=1 Tax=Herbaspirillum autotrophicum TaxID=180195 RepID=UPI00067C6BA1|nr:TIR domain-containing protein [Herbaspirillum autotrophicum]
MSEATLGARFQGETGQARLIESLKDSKIVARDEGIANAIAAKLKVRDVASGDVLIAQNGTDTDIYFILAGKFNIVVNGKLIGVRVPGDHVGEMSAIQPMLSRAASIIATENGAVGKLSEADFRGIAEAFPLVWRWVAKELVQRLHQRNAQIAAARERITVFLISSVEALPIARAIANAFEHDEFNVIPWQEGVFKVASYSLEALEHQLGIADFAIAIAQPDDLVKVRRKNYHAPRDNVIFELGFFMGRLGRNRAILMEPWGEDVKLPTDLKGVTTIRYKYSAENLDQAMHTACNRLRSHILELGAL